MWFDARAALARIEGGAYPAPEVLDRLNSRNSQDSQPLAVQSGFPPATVQFAEFATPQPPKPLIPESTGNPPPLSDAAKRRAAALPSKPPTCALCGETDWQVSLADTKRRKLHVACWRAEQVDGAQENGGR
jgi:hypothetical protein